MAEQKKKQPKKSYADLLGNLKKTADEMANQKQEGKPSSTGSATVSSNDSAPQLANTTDPNKSSKRVIINDKTGKEGEGKVVYRIGADKAKEAVKLIAKRAKSKGAKKITAKKTE